MDPSTMDFMMHPPEHIGPSSSSANVDHAARSACPALRAAAVAEHNQHPPVMFPSRPPNYYFDPVHSNPHFWQTLPPPHARWTSDPPFQHSPPILPLTTGQMNQPPYQSNGPNLYNSHSNPPQFRNRAPLLSLQRIGGTAPIQHSQGSYSGSNQSQPQAGIPGETGPGASVHGPRTNLPSLASMPPTSTGQNLQTTFPQTSHPTQPSSQHNPAFPRHSIPSPFTASDATPPSSGQTDFGSSNSSNSSSSSPPRRAPGGPRTSDMPNEATSSEPRRASTTRSRRAVPRLPSESGWSSDDDSEPDAAALSFLEAAVSSTPGIDNAPDERMRAHQLIRGAMSSNKRVASKKAITSLESVAIPSLPENERTCVICYNDYGVETPEGISENPLRLPKCKHVFGDHCIKKWFEESDSCPYCRDKVPSEPQYRNTMHAHNVYRFLRQHHQVAMQMQMRNAREHERSDADPLRQPTDAMLGGLAALASSPFQEIEHTSLNGASARRQDNQSTYNSRTPAWHGNFGDRHSPLPFNEAGDRRRVRPRHGSLRGYPSGRTHFSSTSAVPTPQYPWPNRPTVNHSHNRQHSASSVNTTTRPTFDASVHAFQFQPPMGGVPPPEPYLNPLNIPGPGNNGEDYPILPHMRSQHVSPLSPTYAGPEVYMSNADESIYGGAISHQQS
ncbi:hypothetical protein F4811DRAFT_37985 [Daldinia bambusicola]|nr:hypothetical protein F4811DRAFT_37985 [Daldinia bambusicola]